MKVRKRGCNSQIEKSESGTMAGRREKRKGGQGGMKVGREEKRDKEYRAAWKTDEVEERGQRDKDKKRAKTRCNRGG